MKSLSLALVACGLFLVASNGGVQADPVGGKIVRIDNVKANDTDIWTFHLRGGEVTRIRLAGDGDTCLELRVYDENGNLIGSDTLGYHDVRQVSIRPYWTGPFQIKIRNVGRGSNTYVLALD